jgi:hypothetical protein
MGQKCNVYSKVEEKQRKKVFATMSSCTCQLLVSLLKLCGMCHWLKCELVTQLIAFEFWIFIEHFMTKITQSSISLAP